MTEQATRCVRLRVVFTGGDEREYPVHQGGDWFYREQPDRLIVRPYGTQGNARHEIPLRNVASVMVVCLDPFHQGSRPGETEVQFDPEGLDNL